MKMRELKFRAWDIVNKRMYQVEEITFKSLSPCSTPLNWDENGPNSYLGVEKNFPFPCPTKEKHWCSTVKVSDDTQITYNCSCWMKLHQYTGLKDKNGKEIYEGDRLAVRIYGSSENICIVKWEDDGARFYCEFKHKDSGDTIGDFVYLRAFSPQLMVIGNEFEGDNILVSIH